MSFDLNTALAITTEAHMGQKGRNGASYIETLRQLEQKLADQNASENIRMCALLHNVVEKSPTHSLESLAEQGCPEEVLQALTKLAHIKDQVFIDARSCELIAQAVPAEDATYQAREEEYLRYIDQLKSNEIARQVKIADLSFYLEDERVLKAERRELKNKFRQEKYRKALERLQN